MVYEEFLTAVKQQMELALGSGYTLSLRKVQKNNGLVLDGLCITKGTDPVSPSIYLNQYYQQYRKGSSIASLVKELLELYYQNPMPPVDHEAFSSYEKMKHAISFKLIHADSNRELLEDVPYVPWLDLAIVFYLCIHEDENGLMTALIHHSHMKLWGCSLDELKETALANAQLLFPPVISSMACILEEMSRRFSHAASFLLMKLPPSTFSAILLGSMGLPVSFTNMFSKTLQKKWNAISSSFPPASMKFFSCPTTAIFSMKK